MQNSPYAPPASPPGAGPNATARAAFWKRLLLACLLAAALPLAAIVLLPYAGTPALAVAIGVAAWVGLSAWVLLPGRRGGGGPGWAASVGVPLALLFAGAIGVVGLAVATLWSAPEIEIELPQPDR